VSGGGEAVAVADEGRAVLQVVRLRPGARLPERQTALASGYDLHACIEDGPLTIGETPVRVPTGIAVAAPAGIDLQVRPRSGLSARGVMVVFGTVDADYRGELLVTMYCLPAIGRYEIRDGDRIAQIVVARLVDIDWAPVEALDETARGAGGHGSTGLR
jgi:dUTP pyrophosphatase